MLIYKITNITNNKVYIGLTIRTLQERWNDYKKDFKYIKPGDKNYRPIIAALQKYGLNNFKIEVEINNISDLKKLDKLEIEKIKEYNSCNPNYGYNVELGGNSIGKHSEQTKQKISEAQKGEKNHMFGIKGAENKTSKKIIDITTGIIYDSVTIATKSLGLDEKCLTKIAACARGIKTSAYGHIFRYVDSNTNPIFVDIEYNIKTVKPILNLDSNQIYYSEQEAAENLGITKSYVSQILRGSIKSNKYNLIWLPEKEIKVPKKCKVYDKVLEKYKYLINTVPNLKTERCND